MAESSRSTSVDKAELGALLALLHGADAGFRSVQATWRVWRHEERLRQAFLADAEEQKRRGASISTISVDNGAPEPAENEETVLIWREGERFREEHHGGRRDGYYAVADGQFWWMWDEHMGAHSNQDDPSLGSGVGQELEVMLNPTPLLSSLRLRAAGSSDVAGRATITVHASPRPQDPRYARSLELHQLGTGADHYTLQVDQEHGVLLAAIAIRDGQPFHTIAALTIRFDEAIPCETFRFTPPEGEEIKTIRDRRLQHITLTEAQQRAPFTVLMPNRVPADWQVRCTFIDASQRPASPAQVSLGYRSGDGHESISISQMTAADRASHHYESVVNDENWQGMSCDGASVKVRPADFGQAQAHLERDGTFAFLVSDNLTNNQLGTIAAGLRPAPSTSSI
jgi:outer membrane lipoprotein-sorting protein